MAGCQDDVAIGSQLMVGAGVPIALGIGPSKIRGSAYVEGPLQVGAAQQFSTAQASLMVGISANEDVRTVPIYSLWCKLMARFQKFVRVDELLKSKFIEADLVRTRILQASIKNFMIDHPTKPEKKLIHSCLEGPENAVYVRGKVLNRTEIELPEYWTKLIDETTITVSLTPIGAHQDVIVKRIGDNKVYLQAKAGIPINCYYHIFATRRDVKRLVIEVDA
jgi:hypothetical protein